MKSCLYKARVMHNRLKPKKHRFHYSVFMFYLNLDEIDALCHNHWLLSRNRFNLFSFRDNEHLQLPADRPDTGKSTKEHLVNYLQQHGYHYTNETILLLTNLNMLGYNFNPVSFYFVVNAEGQAQCAVVEVSNTFREMKPYFLSKDCLQQGKFVLSTPKYFYVSPFIDHDANFEFALEIPGETLNLRIDDSKNGDRFFISTLTGTRKELSSARLLQYALRFPLIPLWIMTLIHWNALLLWLKKFKFYRKSELPELQRNVLRKYNN